MRERQKKESKHIYALHLTERQAKLLSWACDSFSRMIIGQDWTYQEMFEQGWEHRCKEATGNMMDEKWDGGWSAMRHDAEELSRQIKKRFWGLDRQTMNGVGYDDSADILFDMHQVLRHQLWLDRPEDKKSHITVDSDEAMRFGSEPLCHISTVRPVDYSKPTLVFYCSKCGRPYQVSALARRDGVAIWDLEDAIHNATNNGERMEIVYGDLNPLRFMCKCNEKKK